MAARNGHVSREVLAFRSLLDDDTEEEDSPHGHRNPSRKAAVRKQQNRRGNAGTTAVPGFALRDTQMDNGTVSHNEGGATKRNLPGISLLKEMFPGVSDVILSEVWTACGSSMSATADALLSMNLGSASGGGDSSTVPSFDGVTTWYPGLQGCS